HGQTLFRSAYFWYRITETSVTTNSQASTDRLIFATTSQAAPFDLPGGSTWSREVLFIPRETWAVLDWVAFERRIASACSKPNDCQGEVIIRVRLDDGISLGTTCRFALDGHVLAHLRGGERRYYTSPVCGALSPNEALHKP